MLRFVACCLVGCSVASAAQSRGPVIAGFVVDSATAGPIRDVEVVLAGNVIGRTDSSGVFAARAAAGQQRVTFRKLGFRPVDLTFTLSGADTVNRRIIMSASGIQLEKVVVETDAAVIRSFDENRRIGLGRFLTRADLQKEGTRRLSDVLAGMPGTAVVRGRSEQAWLASKRMPPTSCRPVRSTKTIFDDQAVKCLRGQGIYVPEDNEASAGIVTSCYAQVYVDDVLQTPTRPTEPFNINEFPLERLEAVEYYAGPSQTPAKYSRLDSRCGVLVLWTRRSP